MTGPQTVEFAGDATLRLVAAEWNPGADRGILLLHGGGQNRFSWRNTGQILADRGFHVVAFDARGHGDSDRSPAGDYSLHTLTRDAIAVLKAIGRPVALVGASMGGMTGILAAREAGPGMVSELVLVDVVPRFEQEGTSRIRDFMTRHLDGFATLDEAAEAIAAYLPQRRRDRNLDGLRKNLREREGRWHWHWDPAFVSAIQDDRGLVGDLERAAAELTIPVLLVRGRMSDVVSAEGAEAFLAAVPRAQFVELPRAGHTAAGDDNDAFSAVVVDFLTR